MSVLMGCDCWLCVADLSDAKCEPEKDPRKVYLPCPLCSKETEIGELCRGYNSRTHVGKTICLACWLYWVTGFNRYPRKGSEPSDTPVKAKRREAREKRKRRGRRE